MDGDDFQVFMDKRQGGDEWTFRTHWATGRLEFVWWDSGGTFYTSVATADTPLVDGQTGWVRVRKSGTVVSFWYSITDTNDHAAATWTQIGSNVATNVASIRGTVATHIAIGGQGLGRAGALYGFVYTAAILDDTTVRADPRFYLSTEWTVGEDEADTASDGVNTWTLGGHAAIVGDNVEGAAVLVECAFGTNPFDHGPFWSDLTDDVKAISTNRGRNAELDRFDAGTATFEIDNTSGWYHSHNTASPYYPNVRPMVPIRVRAVWDGTIYPVWSGFVERWPVNFPGNIESIATVDAVDLFKPLSLADASIPNRAALVGSLSPVAWWRFNDDTDSSAAGTHDLTITGASTGDVGVWTGDQAGAFDGVDDFATVANEVDVELLSDMSLEMWFRPQLATTPTVTTFNTDDTWVCPAGVSAVTVEVWGGGAGGTNGTIASTGGGGGGAGGFARKTVPVTPGVSYTIEVGAAGGAALPGGASWFGASLVRANGGVADGNGGAGGVGTVGSILVTGGRGAHGRAITVLPPGGGAGGGGGGAGSFTGNGGNGTVPTGAGTVGGPGGNGGGTGGDGGDGGSATVPTAGSAGVAPGGGGGGGGATGAAAASGGVGAAGRVRLSYAVEANMVPVSAMGVTSLYLFQWDGYYLRFLPGTSSGSRLVVGEAEADQWHHVIVTVDWTGSSRAIKGYLDGQLTLEATVAHQPVAETRVVNVGRRATAIDQHYKGDISEIVIYNTVLTPTDAATLYAGQLEGFETQPTGERIAYVLETPEVGVGVELTDHDLDTGQTIISGPNSPSEVTALEAIQIAADTEFGSFFIAADGTPTFQDRHHRMVDMVTPLAALDETDYETIYLLGKDDLKVANDVRVAPSDTADPFIVTDADSKQTYGRRTLELTVYPDNQNEAYDMAVWLLGLFKQPRDDIASIPFRMYEEVTDFPTLLAAELGDRYTVTVPLEGDDLDIDVYLERISHTIDLTSWTMDWSVTPATEATTFWILGVAGFSELGETTVPGF